MVEPPGQLVRTAVLEIDNGVFPRTENVLTDVLARLVRQAVIFDLGAGRNACLIEPRKDRCRGQTIKAVVVIKNTHRFRHHCD
jgi:hypothetical protein